LALSQGHFRFRSGGFLRATLIAIVAAAAVIADTQFDLARAEAEDTQLTEFANRVSQLVSQVTAAAPAGAAPKIANRQPNLAVRELIKEVGADVQLYLRPENQTVSQLRAGALAPAFRGVAPLAVAESHERTARKFFASHRALMRLADPDNE